MYARFFRVRPAPPSNEVGMIWSMWIRQIHRWLAILFTMTVMANFIAFGFGEPPMWLVYSPLPPLFLLMFSGLYMFFLPHVAKWRHARQPS